MGIWASLACVDQSTTFESENISSTQETTYTNSQQIFVQNDFFEIQSRFLLRYPRVELQIVSQSVIQSVSQPASQPVSQSGLINKDAKINESKE